MKCLYKQTEIHTLWNTSATNISSIQLENSEIQFSPQETSSKGLNTI